MTTRDDSGSPDLPPVRPPAVAGAFYPAHPGRLRPLVVAQLAEAERRHPAPADVGRLLGLLVPHAGLEYSGVVAGAGWRLVRLGPPESPARGPTTVVILGTNHGAAWLTGVGTWDRGSWRTPFGDVTVDGDLAAAIVELGRPFVVDLDAHVGEHSIEVQLPFLQAIEPEAQIVPLAVSTGVAPDAMEAGVRLGSLLAERRRAGQRIFLAISSDMAHYPSHTDAARVTLALEAPILGLSPEALAARERALRGGSVTGLVCGMCGIEPAVLGLAALRAAGATHGVALAAATSADAGGPPDRAVGYLAAAFMAG